MLMFGLRSYIALKRRLRYAVRYADNVYLCEGIPSSFVLGIFRPVIYIPSRTKKEDVDYIILHERTHIGRLDHLSKIAGYILLSLHWINPFNWLMFRLFSDDMECACDEGVLSVIGAQNKKRYMNVLLDAAVNRNTMYCYSVCFAANSTKRRIKNMIALKKKSKVWNAIAVLSCAAMLVAFGTNAAAEQSDAPAENTRASVKIVPSESLEEGTYVYVGEIGEVPAKFKLQADGAGCETVRVSLVKPEETSGTVAYTYIDASGEAVTENAVFRYVCVDDEGEFEEYTEAAESDLD